MSTRGKTPAWERLKDERWSHADIIIIQPSIKYINKRSNMFTSKGTARYWLHFGRRDPSSRYWLGKINAMNRPLNGLT